RLTADATRVLDEADGQLRQIHDKLSDPIRVCELLSNIDEWKENLAKARAAWQHANALAASNDDVLTPELADRLHLANECCSADEADWTLAKQLDDVRFEAAMSVEIRRRDAGPKYEALFSERGFNWKTSKPDEIGARIRQAKLRYVLVAALDDWSG